MLHELYKAHFGQAPYKSTPLAKAGSNRQYFRLEDNSGQSVIGVIGTLIVAIIQIIMHKYTIGADSYMFGQMSCTVTDPVAFRKAFDDYIASQKMQVIANKISYHEDGSASFDFTIRMHSDTTVNDLTTFLESVDCVRSLSCRVER